MIPSETGQMSSVTCAPSGFKKSLNEWFDTSAFASSEVTHYDNSRRNMLRGPGLNSWDLNLAKSFSFSERVRM
jgi:hypothetical protein